MNQANPNDVAAVVGSSATASETQNHPETTQENQESVVEEMTETHVETSTQDKVQCESMLPTAATEEADDDVLFIFSAPRSKKQRRRRLESICTSSGLVQASAPPDLSSALDHTTRRGTTGMVQGLEGCHIDDNKNAPIDPRRASLPAAPPVVDQQIQVLQLSPIDPATEPNFVAMQAIPLPDSCLQWWNEPVPEMQSAQNTLNTWTDFQNGDNSSTEYCEDTNSAEKRIVNVDAQVSPRTKPATPLPANNTSKDSWTEARELARKVNDSMRFRHETYSTTPMPAWSKSWTSFAESGSTPSRRTRIPSNTPLSLIRNNFSSKYTQAQQAHIAKQTQCYPSRSAEVPPRLNPGKGNEISQSIPGSRPTGSGERFNGVTAPRSAGIFTTSQQLNSLARGQISSDVRSSSNLSGGEPMRISNQQRAPPTQIDNPNDVLRKPSLYKIPTWNSPSTLGNSVVLSSPQSYGVRRHNAQGEVTAGLRTDYQSRASDVHHIPNTQSPQSLHGGNGPEPRRRRAPKHSPNLIVDIAETCQQLFPFELIADRHSVPVQKVLDTFSAIIQLPLLRNADDKRRHGSLAKQRMRDFREAKKAMIEDRRGVKRAAENAAAADGSGEKRIRLREQTEPPLAKLHAAAAVNSSGWARGTFRT